MSTNTLEIVSTEVHARVAEQNYGIAGTKFMQHMGGFPNYGILPVALRWVSASRRSMLQEMAPEQVNQTWQTTVRSLYLPWRSWLITTFPSITGDPSVTFRARLFFHNEPITSRRSNLYHAPLPRVAPGTGIVDTSDIETTQAHAQARATEHHLLTSNTNAFPSHVPWILEARDLSTFSKHWEKLSWDQVMETDFQWWGYVGDLIDEVQAEERQDEPSTTVSWLCQWMQ